jgi:hypothetical protein
MHPGSATFFTLAVKKHAGLRTRDTISASRLIEAFGITIRGFDDEFVARGLVVAAYSADAVPTTKGRRLRRRSSA